MTLAAGEVRHRPWRGSAARRRCWPAHRRMGADRDPHLAGHPSSATGRAPLCGRHCLFRGGPPGRRRGLERREDLDESPGAPPPPASRGSTTSRCRPAFSRIFPWSRAWSSWLPLPSWPSWPSWQREAGAASTLLELGLLAPTRVTIFIYTDRGADYNDLLDVGVLTGLVVVEFVVVPLVEDRWRASVIHATSIVGRTPSLAVGPGIDLGLAARHALSRSGEPIYDARPLDGIVVTESNASSDMPSPDFDGRTARSARYVHAWPHRAAAPRDPADSFATVWTQGVDSVIFQFDIDGRASRPILGLTMWACSSARRSANDSAPSHPATDEVSSPSLPARLGLRPG